jgi:16S rRNA (guanine527-N7)-methyltransferase
MSADDRGRDAFLRARPVSRETLARLDGLVAALDRWSSAINLVARGTLADTWRRHILDSAQLIDLAPSAAETWVDLGSGAGFPGLVVAAIAREERPGLSVTLVESDARKSAFLREAIRATGAPASVRTQRIEADAPQPADVVSARALAPLPRLLDLAAPWMRPGAVALFPKGAGHRGELTSAGERWHSAVETFRSLADPDGVVLRLTEVRRALPR